MAATHVAVSRERTRLLSESALLPLTVGALVIWQIGLYIDVWSHLRFGFEIETFLTWAHAVLYGGCALTAVPSLLYLVEGQLIGAHGALLPPGYRAVLIGVGFYGVGGAFDFIWHGAFGFEVRHDAALSPSHLWLALAFTICSVGLLRAAVLQMRERGSRNAHFGSALVLSSMILLGNWYISYGSPLITDFATGGAAVRDRDGYAGIAWTNWTADIGATNGIFLFNLVVVLFVVFALRHLRLETGAISVMLLTHALIIAPATNQWLILPSIVCAALAAEYVWWSMRKGRFSGVDGTTGYWLIGALLPLVQVSVYLVALAAFGGGLTWTPHLAVGVPVAATIYGLMAAALLAPPAFLRRA